MYRRLKKVFSCLLVVALLITTMAPLAEARSFFTARRTFGVIFLGGSVFMAKKAIDFRRDANTIYESYKTATIPQDADQLFDRSTDRDTKSQMAAGISAVLLISGLRLLLFSGVDDNIPRMDRKIDVNLTSDVQKRSLGITLKKKF